MGDGNCDPDLNNGNCGYDNDGINDDCCGNPITTPNCIDPTKAENIPKGIACDDFVLKKEKKWWMFLFTSLAAS